MGEHPGGWTPKQGNIHEKALGEKNQIRRAWYFADLKPEKCVMQGYYHLVMGSWYIHVKRIFLSLNQNHVGPKSTLDETMLGEESLYNIN